MRKITNDFCNGLDSKREHTEHKSNELRLETTCWVLDVIVLKMVRISFQYYLLFYGYENCSLTLQVEMFEKRVVGRTFGSKQVAAAADGRGLDSSG